MDIRKFNPATHRGVLATDGSIVVLPIPLEVLALPLIEPAEFGDPFQPRIVRAMELAAKGHIIDVPIDVWGWGAANTMRLRRMYGKTTVPDAFNRQQIVVSEE